MPSIIDGLFAGRAGIQSHGTGIAVLADNIANANTTAFKQSRADFADLLAGNLGGGGSISTGSGSAVIAVTPILSQGTFEFTGRGLDTGVDGNGYFVVQDGATGQRFYTRAGNFKLDTEGNLLDQNGFGVLGFPSSGAGGLQALNVNSRSQGSIDSGSVTIGGNLDSTSALATPPITAEGTDTTFSALNTAASFSTFYNVFDTLGGSHTITTYFFHNLAGGNWQAQSYVDAGEVGGTAGDARLLSHVDLTFTASGTRTPPVLPVDDILAPAWSNGAAVGAIDLSYGGFTAFASSSAISNISQDGTGSGNVVGFSIEPNGNLFAQLDNGQTSSIGILALSNFSNNEGLRRVGGSLYAETSASGAPVVGRPATGTYGSIQAGAVELSNADIAADFIKLISLQRGFQSSSRIISSINDLLNEIINLA